MHHTRFSADTGPGRHFRRPGNNHHGNIGLRKCAECRRLKSKCEYELPDDICERCRHTGKPCGPKTHAKAKDDSRAPDQGHKNAKITPEPPSRDTEWWSWDEPFLPKIFQNFDNKLETKLRVLDKLQAELNQLESLGMWTSSSRTSQPPENTTPQSQPHAPRLGPYVDRSYPNLVDKIDQPYLTPHLRSQTPLLPVSNLPASNPPSSMLIENTQHQQPYTVLRPRSDGPSTLLHAADLLGNVLDPGPQVGPVDIPMP